jgi:hypothetical protein
MSYSQINQMHSDIALQVQKTPDGIVAHFTVNIYNVLVREAQKKYPGNALVQALPHISDTITYSDFLAPIGQLKQLLSDAESQEIMDVLSRPDYDTRSEFVRGMDRW